MNKNKDKSIQGKTIAPSFNFEERTISIENRVSRFVEKYEKIIISFHESPFTAVESAVESKAKTKLKIKTKGQEKSQKLIDIYLAKTSALCLKEKKLVSALYPCKNTRHKYFTKYRNRISAFLRDTSLSDLNRKEFSQTALDILKLDIHEGHQRSLDYQVKLDRKTNNVAVFDLEVFIQSCKAFIKSSDPYTVAIGLMGLTGRRSIEILKTARFKIVDKNNLDFSGQAKTKNSINSRDRYIIPCLDDAPNIISAMQFIRKTLNLSSFENEKIDKAHSGKLLTRVKKLSSCVHGNEFISLNCRSLRSMYVMSSYEIFKMSTKVAFNAYASKVLGHSHLDKDTANAYSYFAIKR